MRLDYDKLVADYVESLQAKLRNFAVEPEFLGMWVHDEDDHKSLYEMFLAAKGAGRPALTVSLGAATWNRLDEARLSRDLGLLGAARIEKKKAAVEITIDFGEHGPSSGSPPKAGSEAPRRRPADPAPRNGAAADGAGPAAPRQDGLHPAYRAAIEKAARDIRFEGALAAAPPGQTVASAEDGGAALAVSVDAEGVVRGARHAGAEGPLRAMLDVLCGAILPNRPLQEARDHAVIRLEALLRDRKLPPPVRGVVTPFNADPSFERPQRMLRALFKAYAEKTGKAAQPNFWDDGPCEAWRALSSAERLARARAAVADGCRELGLDKDGVEAIEMIGETRVVLAHVPAASAPHFAPAMMRLEKILKHALDPRIEIHLESLDDKNRRAQRTRRPDKLT